MRSAPPVRVVGDALLDVHVVPAAAPRAGSDVPARVTLLPGGQGANVAVRLARAGVPVELVCAIGPDAAGELVRATLAAEGVRLAIVPTALTGTVVVLRAADGERTMLSQRVPLAAAAARLPLSDDDAWLVLSGYPLAEPDGSRLADAARSAGRRVVAGCAVGTEAIDAWRAQLARIEPHLLVLNREEAERLGPIPGEAALIVTDPRGARLTRAGHEERVEPPAAEGPTVDTTGAGDALVAGLVAALLDAGWPPTDAELRVALAEATALAAQVTQVEGAQGRVAGERRGQEVAR